MVSEFNCGGKSRHIQRLRYDSNLAELEVLFRDSSTAVYAKVPAEVYRQMQSASSVGKFFHHVIRVHYPQIARTYPRKEKPYGSNQVQT
jgi:hypothetical protein